MIMGPFYRSDPDERLIRKFYNSPVMVDKELMKDLESRSAFESFGDLDRFVRERAGLNRADLARLMGYDKGYGAYIQQVEEGLHLQSPRMVMNYIRVFDVEPGYFMRIDVQEYARRRERKLESELRQRSG